MATSRVETIYADVAVAVHPKDKRFKDVESVINPLTLAPIPLIRDDFVDPTFGTGVVKITPAHSSVDNEVARRHNLPLDVIAFHPNGKMLKGEDVVA